MLTHDEMVGLQAEKHQLINTHTFRSTEEYVLHLMHSYAYVQASKLIENKTVLDLGCNTGYGCEILSRTAQRVVGVDVSPEAVARAKKYYSQLGIDFHLIDGKQLPFNDNEFDVVISCQVIEHIVDWNAYIHELKRVLSHSGIALFTTPNALLRLDPGMKPWNKFHVREFDYAELQTLLEPHFSYVHVLGLFAQEPVYNIEITRLSRKREAARRREQQTHSHKVSAIAKKFNIASISKELGKLFAGSSRSKKDLDKDFIEQHGLRDFFYHTSELDTALDLLALCTDDPGTLKGLEQRLKGDF